MNTQATPKCHIRFLPDGIGVSVPQGTTILDAARLANLYLNSVCGGDGICGKCKVILKSGRVDQPPTTLLSRDELLQQYLLACSARVLTDAEILVGPKEASMLPAFLKTVWPQHAPKN